MGANQTLLEEVSPLGNVQAIVEADERACYFYLYGAPDTNLGVRSVWVRNLLPAPAELDVSRMRAGEPPMNPADHCHGRGPSPPPRAGDLRVCWLPEGNGAALYEADDVLAIIPPWSGTSGFHGYARDCKGEGPVAWALPAESALRRRFEDAAAFWESWDDDPWPTLRDRLTESIERALGPHSNYYAIDGGSWPPRALLRIPSDQGTALVTIGMSLLPQPNVEMATEESRGLRRIELAVLLPPRFGDADVKGFASYLSGQAGLPWSRFTWLGPGHTLRCDAWRSKQFEFALLSESAPAANVELPDQCGDPVRLLWLVPISAKERDLALEHGSSVMAKGLPETRWRDA